MSLALSTMWWGEGDLPIEELVQRTLALGFNVVELDYRRSPQSLERLRAVMAAAGLEAHSMHAPFPCPPGEAPLRQADLAADDDVARRYAESLVARTLEEAAAWGISVIVLHAGDIRPLASLEEKLKSLVRRGSDDEQRMAQLRGELKKRRAQEAPRRLEWVRRALARLVPRAEELGVVIGLETRADYRDLPSFGEMGALLDEFGPAVGYVHDMGHAFRQDASGFCLQEDWLLRYAERTVGLHLHDAVGLTDHFPPGQGAIPYAQLVPLFPAQTRCVLEVRAVHDAAAMRAGLSFLQALGVSG
jgi:sugar phosphate isomerase/epimerase